MKVQKESNLNRGSISEFNINNQQNKVIFRTDFDSGNGKIKQVAQYTYRIQCVVDGAETGHSVNSKSWFYFSVQGFPVKAKVKFIVSRIQALMSLYNSKWSRYYRPVYRIDQKQWKRHEKQCELTLNEEGYIESIIQYTFKTENEKIEFAFCYPYKYSQNIQFIGQLQAQSDIYYHKEVLIYSPEQKPIHLITITNPCLEILPQQIIPDPHLFPDKNRALKFKKPVVLISARVHPGQTAASYAMEGVLNFLLDKNDLRAHLLREMFVFMVIPMINVDGVYHGHFRMNTFGQNLNRFYIKPDLQKQPAIYAIKAISRQLIQENRLCFYCDLHGHNAKKGCFIYGNAFPDFVEQVQSQIFCKMLAMNDSGFQYQYCNFSQRHMNARDRFEDLTKEGCGRVVMHRQANIVHSYSLECGSISANNSGNLPEVSNPQFSACDKKLTADILIKEEKKVKLPDNSILFTEDSYRNLGKNLLVSLLDIFDKNPYNRVYNSKYTSMEMLRRITAFEIFHSAERFRMYEKKVFGKVKNINLLIQETLYNKPQYRGLFNSQGFQNSQLNMVDWPKNIQGLSKIPKSQPFINKNRTLINQINEIRSKQNIEQNTAKKTQNSFYKVEQQTEVRFSVDEVLQTGRGHRMKFNKISSDMTIHENKADLSSESDESQVKQEELNRQILLLCDNQKQEKELMAKIMDDNFDEKSYKEMEKSYKNKQSLEQYIKQAKQQQKKQQSVVHTVKNFNLKQPKYRVNRKVVINTFDVSRPSKPVDNCSISRPNDERKPTPAQQFRKNIYDAIKMQIKEGLRREYDKRHQRDKINMRMIDSFKAKNNRTRSNYNYDRVRLKSKVKLPSLGSNMYIITTSTRALQKS